MCTQSPQGLSELQNKKTSVVIRDFFRGESEALHCPPTTVAPQPDHLRASIFSNLRTENAFTSHPLQGESSSAAPLSVAALFHSGGCLRATNRRSVCEGGEADVAGEGGRRERGGLLGAMQSCDASERNVMGGGKSAAMVG
jgi:hypothetical protein